MKQLPTCQTYSLRVVTRQSREGLCLIELVRAVVGNSPYYVGTRVIPVGALWEHPRASSPIILAHDVDSGTKDRRYQTVKFLSYKDLTIVYRRRVVGTRFARPETSTARHSAVARAS